MSSSTSAVSQSNTRYVYPFTCIMHNLPIKLDKDGKGSSKSYTWMRDMLRRHGYTNIKKVHTSWSQDRGFLGYAMIEFEGFGKKHDSFVKREDSTIDTSFVKRENTILIRMMGYKHNIYGLRLTVTLIF